MQTKIYQAEEAGQFSKGAAINAIYRDRENKSRFSAREQARAETVKDLVSIVFPSSVCYVNYRQKFISVKIEKPQKPNSKQAAQLDDVMSDYNATKVVTPQGIVYRIPRQ
jgi:hypothetical protein